MITLTPEQSAALRGPTDGIIRMVDPTTSSEYVLLSADVYERVRRLFEDTAQDAFLAQMESVAAAGWDDPTLDIYNDLDPRRK